MSYPPFAKLVRDRIPEIMHAAGASYEATLLRGQELREALIDKLDEERLEIREATSSDERLEEIADAYEVLRALAEQESASMATIALIADAKRATRGGFDMGVWVDTTHVADM